jgi:tetratricopeptide (TPR) repeat protein
MRLGLMAAGAVALVALVVGGALAWQWRQESRGQVALAEAARLVRQAETGQEGAEARERAMRALQGVVEEYPRLSAGSQAAYQLGNLRYAAGQYAMARSAYEAALAKGAAGSLRALAALGIGYTWEAEKNWGNAAAAYQAVLKGLGPDDPLYEEGLLALGRAQELGGRPDAALETYQRILKDMPGSARAEDLRVRIASLRSRAR